LQGARARRRLATDSPPCKASPCSVNDVTDTLFRDNRSTATTTAAVHVPACEKVRVVAGEFTSTYR
jgi:hypothetical protein